MNERDDETKRIDTASFFGHRSHIEYRYIFRVNKNKKKKSAPSAKLHRTLGVYQMHSNCVVSVSPIETCQRFCRECQFMPNYIDLSLVGNSH